MSSSAESKKRRSLEEGRQAFIKLWPQEKIDHWSNSILRHGNPIWGATEMTLGDQIANAHASAFLRANPMTLDDLIACGYLRAIPTAYNTLPSMPISDDGKQPKDTRPKRPCPFCCLEEPTTVVEPEKKTFRRRKSF